MTSPSVLIRGKKTEESLNIPSIICMEMPEVEQIIQLIIAQASPKDAQI